MGGGVNPAAPRPPTEGGEGNLGPLRRSKLAGKRGAEGRDGRLKEKSWMREGERGGEPPRLPHLPHPPQPQVPGGEGGGFPGLSGATLKPRVLRSETKSSFFERSGCALELCDSARAGERGAGGDGRGRGGAARTPTPGLPTHALLLEAIPYPPLSRCGARIAVKVTGRTVQRGTGNSGPCGQRPPHTHPAHVPAPRVQRDRAAGRNPATPVIPGVRESPGFGVQARKEPRLAAPNHCAQNQELGARCTPPLAPQEATGLECLGGPPQLGNTRAPPEPFSPPKVSPPGFPGQQVSPTRAAPAPTCVRRGLHAGGPGARRPDSGPQLPAPALPRPVPSTSGRPRRFTRPRLSEPLPSPPPPPGLISHSGAGTPTPPGRRRHRRVAMETLCPPPPRALTQTHTGTHTYTHARARARTHTHTHTPPHTHSPARCH